jgi:hypothetical protein
MIFAKRKATKMERGVLAAIFVLGAQRRGRDFAELGWSLQKIP